MMVETDNASVTFDAKVHSVLSVKKAAYKYIARFASDITTDDTTILCRLTFTPPPSHSTVDHLIAEFKKEALDQSLREQLSRETKAIRNLILAHAFSQSGLVNP